MLSKSNAKFLITDEVIFSSSDVQKIDYLLKTQH